MEYLDEVFRTQKLHHGKAHESCANTHPWMGNMVKEWGDYDDTLEYFDVDLKVEKAKLGKDHEILVHYN
eukprot:7012921-Ditylum_brightwellii.AAC.1